MFNQWTRHSGDRTPHNRLLSHLKQKAHSTEMWSGSVQASVDLLQVWKPKNKFCRVKPEAEPSLEATSKLVQSEGEILASKKGFSNQKGHSLLGQSGGDKQVKCSMEEQPSQPCLQTVPPNRDPECAPPNCTSTRLGWGASKLCLQTVPPTV